MLNNKKINLTNEQKSFIEFISVSQIRKMVLQSYVLIIFFIPLMVNYFLKLSNIKFPWFIFVAFTNAIFILLSVPVLLKPGKLLSLFHIYLGLLGIYSSTILFGCFIIRINALKQMGIFENILFVLLFILLVYIENYYILRTNFTKYPKSNFRFTPYVILLTILFRILYGFVINATKIDGATVGIFFLSIVFGCMIHSFYRSYLIIKYKYVTSESTKF
jgi:hypothetical protein